MSRDELRLRPEARSVWLDTLTRDQERAFGALIDLIDAASKDLPDKDEWQRDPKFDRGMDVKQVSRVLLLGGGRGSGKTTVANTLREALEDGNTALFDPKIGEKLDGRRTGLQQKVIRLRSQVIVLEPFGVTDVPGDTNVLAALLARLEQLLFPKLTSEDARSTTGNTRQHEAVLELLRLQTDVAIAWDGNLRDRKGSLDPDNYAMEEMRVERVRLQLQDRFETVLRRTARESLGHRDHPALFLLIVDDADVDPARLIELLERLRMVGVAELVVLLVGDIEPIETAFRMDSARRFREVAPGVTADAIGMQPRELSSLTNLFGRSALRKHLPDHQRVLLRPILRARDAVNIAPLRREGGVLLSKLDAIEVSYPAVPHLERGVWTPKLANELRDLDDKRSKAKESIAGAKRLKRKVILAEDKSPATSTQSEDDHEKLREELAAAETDAAKAAAESADARERRRELRSTEPVTLARFMFPPDEWADTTAEQYWYVGSRLLADSPRVALDLWYALRDATAAMDPADPSIAPDHLTEEEGARPEPGTHRLDPRLHSYIRRLAIERLDANSELWDEKRTAVAAAASSRFIHEGDLSGLELTAEHCIREDPDPPVPATHGAHSFIWSRHRGLEFKLQKKEASRVDVGPLVLADDLASLEDRAAADRSMASRKEWSLAWVRTESGDDEKKVDGKKVDVWPIPRYRTTRQIEQFGYEWNVFLDARAENTTSLTAEELANAWVAIHTRVLLGERPTERPIGQAFEVDPSDHVRLPEAKEQIRYLWKVKDSTSIDGWASQIAKHWLDSVDQVLGWVEPGTNTVSWAGADEPDASTPSG